MSYDSIVLLPVVFISTLAALVALVSKEQRRLVLALVGLVGAAWVLWSGLDAASQAGASMPRTGWDAQVAQGHGLWLMSQKAGAYLPWAIAPFAPAIVALALWARGKRRRWLPALAIGVVPMALALWLGWCFAAPHVKGTWRLDDVRWAWGYIAACPEDDGCSAHEVDIACSVVEQIATARREELVRYVAPDEVARALSRCRAIQ